MDGSPDQDKRAAVELAVGISTSINTGVLAVLGAAGVIFVFVVGTRAGLGWFYFLSCITVVLVVASLFIGGHATYELARKGFSGDWTIHTNKRLFGLQATTALCGTVAFFLMTIAGGIANPQDEKAQANLVLRQGLRTLTRSHVDLAAQIQRLKMKVRALENELAR